MFAKTNIKLEKCEVFYDDGQIMVSAFYRNGTREGERKVWYENGHFSEREFYRNGKREGEYKFWHENGRPGTQEFYRNGKREGECKVWDVKGQLLKQKFFRDGKCISSLFNKNAFLRLKRCFRNRSDLLESSLISDLIRMV